MYRPVDEILPVEENSDQVTAVLEVPLTLAVNCWDPPGPSVTLEGDTETAMDAPGLTLIVATFVVEFNDAET